MSARTSKLVIKHNAAQADIVREWHVDPARFANAPRFAAVFARSAPQRPDEAGSAQRRNGPSFCSSKI